MKRKKLIILLCVLALPIGILVGYLNDKEDRERMEWMNAGQDHILNGSANKESAIENTCTVCNRRFNGHGYEETSEGVWEKCQEPYQCYVCSKACGLKHTRQMNNLVNGSDGKVYENNVCSMCKGTGIEKNNGHLTNEYGRKCPMCDGKGVKSY